MEIVERVKRKQARVENAWPDRRSGSVVTKPLVAGTCLSSRFTFPPASAGAFPAAHRDPFDRLLSAQSVVEAVPIVSGDEALDGFGVQRIW